MQTSPVFEKSENYLVMISDENDIKLIIEICTKLRSWNPHAHFLIYVDVFYLVDWNELVQFILQIFWDNMIINVTVYVQVAKDYNKVCKYIFFKFKYDFKKYSIDMLVIDMVSI